MTYVYRVEDTEAGERYTCTARNLARLEAQRIRRVRGVGAIQCTIFKDGKVYAEGDKALKLIRSTEAWPK